MKKKKRKEKYHSLEFDVRLKQSSIRIYVRKTFFRIAFFILSSLIFKMFLLSFFLSHSYTPSRHSPRCRPLSLYPDFSVTLSSVLLQSWPFIFYNVFSVKSAVVQLENIIATSCITVYKFEARIFLYQARIELPLI